LGRSNEVFQLPRVYPILDTARAPDPPATARAWLEGGAAIVQFRHKGSWSREVFAQATDVARLCREAGALFIVNDRADFAALLEAGVHVGQDDLAPADARQVAGEGAVIGFSTHNEEQLRAAAGEPVTYLALGPVFATGSKDRPDPAIGPELLRRWRPLGARPMVAIGGITRATAPCVWQAGADSVAVIADLYPEEATPRALRARMEEWQRLAKM
jgi:thiamine-phosphate pyrophosphorylase